MCGRGRPHDSRSGDRRYSRTRRRFNSGAGAGGCCRRDGGIRLGGLRWGQHDRRGVVGIGTVVGQGWELGGFCEGLVVGIEQTPEIGRGDSTMDSRVLLRVDEDVGEAIDGRDFRHGRQ